MTPSLRARSFRPRLLPCETGAAGLPVHRHSLDSRAEIASLVRCLDVYGVPGFEVVSEVLP